MTFCKKNAWVIEQMTIGIQKSMLFVTVTVMTIAQQTFFIPFSVPDQAVQSSGMVRKYTPNNSFPKLRVWINEPKSLSSKRKESTIVKLLPKLGCH